jgi:hypothetical protein
MISAHGTTIERDGSLITEVRDIRLPELSREVVETTTHGADDEIVKVGIRSYGDLSFEVNFIPANSNHVGLINDWKDGTEREYIVTLPDGALWLFNGYVAQIIPQAPVDGLLSARIVVRPSDRVTFSGLLLTEDGDYLTTEGGSRISLE